MQPNMKSSKKLPERMENSTLSFAMKHTGQLELNFQIETKATLRKYMMLNISKATNAFI